MSSSARFAKSLANFLFCLPTLLERTLSPAFLTCSS
nr:MAG TPA: hypothetical protein [Caudoviricetes sp.]